MFSWDVLWLIAGGIALGQGMSQTGLSKALVGFIPTEAMSLGLVVLVFSILAYVMANFISNTATANLLMPLVASISVNLGVGDSQTAMLVQIAIICSFGMALPISTPPNALAYSTGLIKSQDLMRLGGIISFGGLILVTAIGLILLG